MGYSENMREEAYPISLCLQVSTLVGNTKCAVRQLAINELLSRGYFILYSIAAKTQFCRNPSKREAIQSTKLVPY